jgi:hypothetical protein
MKHILPIITLTTLAAAASAQSAAPAGLTYNRVTVNQNTSGETNRNISVANLIGGSNVLVELSQLNGSGNVEIGYVFKNVTNGIDATVGITSGTADGIGVNLRRSLSELNAGLELAVGYSRLENSGSEVSYEVSYNINKQFSVAFGAEDVNNTNVKSVSVRFNY